MKVLWKEGETAAEADQGENKEADVDIERGVSGVVT